MIGIVTDIHIYHSLVITKIFCTYSSSSLGSALTDRTGLCPFSSGRQAAQPGCGWHSQGGGASLFTGEKIKHHLVHLHFYVTITGAWSSKPRYKDTSSLAHGRTPPTSSKQSQKKNKPNFGGGLLLERNTFISIYPINLSV